MIYKDKWAHRMVELANLVGSWSKDRSRKVGAIIIDSDRTILSTGYNGFPRGVNDNVEERHQRPVKYKWTEHAERNAIFNAARKGIKLEGSSIYIPWFPCVDCSRAIIQSGIGYIIANKPDFSDPIWGEDFKIATEMLNESEVYTLYLEDLDFEGPDM